jgi:hypothetical protein
LEKESIFYKKTAVFFEKTQQSYDRKRETPTLYAVFFLFFCAASRFFFRFFVFSSFCGKNLLCGSDLFFAHDGVK